MKKVLVLLFSLMVTLALCACSNSDTNAAYTIERDGKIFEINAKDGIIFDGTYTYEYKLSGTSSSYDLDITYPNGAAYSWSQDGTMGCGGWSDDYNEELYVSGSTLRDVIERVPKATNPTKFFSVMLLIVLGTFDAIFPKISWLLAYGWRYKNAEPSDIALGLIRVAGIIAIIIGIVMIFS